MTEIRFAGKSPAPKQPRKPVRRILPCTHNLSQGWYLRSTATWTFDLRNDTHYIPLGFGGGKVWKSGDNVLNASIEPQWTVERNGNGQPQFTLLAGLNVTFGK
jgi:hypothetical protein